jgi:hypothetical protein
VILLRSAYHVKQNAQYIKQNYMLPKI